MYIFIYIFIYLLFGTTRPFIFVINCLVAFSSPILVSRPPKRSITLLIGVVCADAEETTSATIEAFIIARGVCAGGAGVSHWASALSYTYT